MLTLGRYLEGTVFLTVFSGVLVYVIGQIIVKLVIEPIHEMRKTIGQISHSLNVRADVISNPGVRSNDKCKKLLSIFEHYQHNCIRIFILSQCTNVVERFFVCLQKTMLCQKWAPIFGQVPLELFPILLPVFGNLVDS